MKNVGVLRRTEVNEQLRPEGLAQLDVSVEQAVRRRFRNKCGVVDALRTDADDHPLVLVLVEQGSVLEHRGRSRSSPSRTLMSPFERSIIPSRKFIDGEPMKPPTKAFAGRV